MHVFAKWLYLMALAVWLGEVIFFSFVVAPSVFRSLESAEAGRVVGAIFPTYYRIGYACGALLLIASAASFAHTASRLWWTLSTVVIVAMVAATVCAGVLVQPRASALRLQIHEGAAPQSVKDEFARLHRRAVQLNSVVLLGGVVLSVIAAARMRS